MPSTKFTDRTDWRELWYADKTSMIDTMIDNLAADLKAGYEPTGTSIMRQLVALADYKSDFMIDSEMISCASDERAERWCFDDLKRRGAIA